MKIVVDTNVLVGAVMSAEGANRAVLRRCLLAHDTPLMGQALFTEMRDVLARDSLFKNAPITAAERKSLFEAFCHGALWVRPYFLWRPNLPDEADNHVLELALNGHAQALVSWNVRDLTRGELRFPQLRIVDPIAYLAFLATPGD